MPTADQPLIAGNLHLPTIGSTPTLTVTLGWFVTNLLPWYVRHSIFGRETLQPPRLSHNSKHTAVVLNLPRDSRLGLDDASAEDCAKLLRLYHVSVQVSCVSYVVGFLTPPELVVPSWCALLMKNDADATLGTFLGTLGAKHTGVRRSPPAQPEGRTRHDRPAPPPRGGNSVQPRPAGRSQGPEAVHVHGKKAEVTAVAAVKQYLYSGVRGWWWLSAWQAWLCVQNRQLDFFAQALAVHYSRPNRHRFCCCCVAVA